MRRYESAAASPPMATTRSQAAVWGAPASASEATATVSRPRRRAVRATRTAISPRLATRSGPSAARPLIALPSRARREGVHVLGDDPEHHLVGAAGDRAEPAVAVVARDRVVPGVAH